MSILITGGTGQTSSRVARLLQLADKKVIVASRNPSSIPSTSTSHSIKFDWTDTTTHGNPFSTGLGKVESAYLLPPAGVFDVFGVMKGFIDLAIEKGVKRFVLISASLAEAGGPSVGQVHQYLVESGVDYCVIRPSWFFENAFSFHIDSIRTDNEIISASEDGKIGFVAADDIADLIVEALLVEKSFNTDLIVTGPELLSFDQVAQTFSSVLGRSIKHTRYSTEELKKRYVSFGIGEEYAEMLAFLESLNAAGEEEKIFTLPVSKKRTGKRTLREFVEQNRDTWIV